MLKILISAAEHTLYNLCMVSPQKGAETLG